MTCHEKKDRVYEFKNVCEKSGCEKKEEEVKVKTVTRELMLNYRQCEGFYVKDHDEMKELGNSIIRSDVIMDNVSNTRIIRLFDLGKRTFEGCSVSQILETAGDTALMTVLALCRVQYLIQEANENGTDDEKP